MCEIEEKMTELTSYTYEIIMVNDASKDHTFDVIRGICDRRRNCTGLDLAKNFGQHAALMAGLQRATGDIVVCLDDDGQTPANEVDKLLEKIEEGYDVVYAKYSQKNHSAFRNFGSRMNKLMTEQMLGKPKDLYISSYFAAKRFVVDEILRYKNAYPYVIGLVLRTTNRICNVPVKHRARQTGQSGYTLKKLLGLWTNGFTSFSVKPLRLATLMGVITAISGFLFAIWIVINKLTNPAVPIGWSSSIAVTLILAGIILLVQGMIGEYLGRVYICLNEAPQYVIRESVRSRELEESRESVPMA